MGEIYFKRCRDEWLMCVLNGEIRSRYVKTFLSELMIGMQCGPKMLRKSQRLRVRYHNGKAVGEKIRDSSSEDNM